MQQSIIEFDPIEVASSYFYTHFYYQEPMHPFSENHLISAVWAMMTLKWGLALTWYGHKYKLILDREYTLM